MASPRLQRGRFSHSGACYLVTTVFHRRIPLFRSPRLAQLAVEELRRCEEEGRAQSMAWVLMPDHVHWLLKLEQGSLGSCMQAFKSRTARGINAVRGASGPVWQAGFYDHQLRNDEDLAAQARYVVANPLRRGLVDRIEDYPHWWCPWIVSTPAL